jgi:hypothetical protein
MDYSAFSGLTITCIIPSISQTEIPKEIERIVKITQIYHLNICVKDMFILTVIKLTKFLPDLITLKLHPLSSENTVASVDKDVYGQWRRERGGLGGTPSCFGKIYHSFLPK